MRNAYYLKENTTFPKLLYKVGMNSTGYFRQCFKDEFGVSPSDYLKQIKNHIKHFTET